MFEVINKRTGKICGTFKNKERARTKRDKLDNEYGAYVHYIREAGK